MTPTPEQAAAIAAIAAGRSIRLDAVAGGAKTTTICLAAQASRSQGCVVAFNKKIADAIKPRLPSHFEAKTLNSLGHGAVIRLLRKSVDLQDRKTSRLVREAGFQKDEAQAIQLGVGLAKQIGFVPEEGVPGSPRRFATIDQLLDAFAFAGVGAIWLDQVIDTLRRDIAQSFAGTIDFDDQVYISTCWSAPYPRFPLLMVDESQDLSLMNQAQLRLTRAINGQIVAVGDPFQSIYAWRGADPAAMEALAASFKLEQFRLTYSFRCARSIIDRAQQLVPHIQARPGAPEGSVTDWVRDQAQDVPSPCAVLSRYNAPLIKLAINLFNRGTRVSFNGARLVWTLGAALRRAGKKGDMMANLQSEFQPLIQGKAAGEMQDRLDCLLAIAIQAKGKLPDALKLLDDIFSPGQHPIEMSSIHGAKGLEWDRVLLLDPDWYRHDDSDEQQEDNLLYVAITRAKTALITCPTKFLL